MISLSSALSVVITLPQARADGTDYTISLNRDAARPDAYSQLFTSPDRVRVGTYLLSTHFYAQADGRGDLVGTASGSVIVRTDGTDATAIVTSGRIATVTVLPGQSVGVGETKDIAFSVSDSGGSLLAVTPGSALFRVVPGDGTRLQINNIGQAVGIAPGEVHVIATVDGTDSPAQRLPVVSNASVTVAPPGNGAADYVVPAGTSYPFQASVAATPSPTDTGVTWAIQEGASGGTITADGMYTAPTIAGTYHVVATSRYDTAKSASVTVHVPVAVTVSPTSVTVTLGDTVPFTATVVGAANPGVVWSIVENTAGGTITPSGVYTAPSLPGTYHVVATSQADPTRQATATVSVIGGSATGTVQ